MKTFKPKIQLWRTKWPSVQLNSLKLIKLADKSEAGWLAVDEYESDELAEDSADEKRIRKAQDKAVRKKFQMAKSASRSRSTGSSMRNVPTNSQDNLLFRGL